MKSRLSRRGLLVLSVGLLSVLVGGALQWVNFNYHNGFRVAGFYLEIAGIVVTGFSGVVNNRELRRGRSLDDRR